MEKDRIIAEFESREERGGRSRYSILRPSNELNIHGLEHSLLRALARAGIDDLENLTFLDVGCGTGGQLLRWIQWGAMAKNCTGIDIVPFRLEQARSRLPAAAKLIEGDASRLPFADASFDITTQFTVLSSVLDDAMQTAVAREMLRVTRPGGLVFSYDFWINPTNPATRGVGLSRLRALFPGCNLTARRITLAPPLSRRLSGISPLLCRVLEAGKLLNSHFLVMIRRDEIASKSRP